MDALLLLHPLETAIGREAKDRGDYFLDADVRARHRGTGRPKKAIGGSDMGVEVDGYVPREGEPMHAYYNRVGPDYFETLGVDIVEWIRSQLIG